MAHDDEDRKRLLRDAIIRYLRANARTSRRCGDTPRGILEKWIPGRGFADAPDYIGDVLAELVERRYLVRGRKPLPNGEFFYSRGDAPELQLKGGRS